MRLERVAPRTCTKQPARAFPHGLVGIVAEMGLDAHEIELGELLALDV